MATLLSSRDFMLIGEAAALLGVSEKTLRRWDREGKLRAYRHPVNGYRHYRTADVHGLLRELPQITPIADDGLVDTPPAERTPDDSLSELPAMHWTAAVALDPRHRPQRWDLPSTTVRRDWRKFPQEAHVINAAGDAYRRLTPEEIAILQGLDPHSIQLPALTVRQKIAAIGDAVPPPLGNAMIASVLDVAQPRLRTSLEICAGAGGLAEGAAQAGVEHLALIDYSDECGRILRNDRPWPADRVHVADVRQFDYSSWRGEVGVLSGGPPCQPWSQSGHRRGHYDERDLLSWIPELVAEVLPEVFVFENVPGLATEQHERYLSHIVNRLRSPGGGSRYGVLVGQFNAADFGVPQVRHRIFLVGIRDGSGADVTRALDLASSRRTHRGPEDRQPPTSRRPWVSVGEAIDRLPDPGGWRRWLVR
jgi:excisionase family DNA binding protein